MRYILLALTITACSRSQTPAPVAASDAQQEVAAPAEDVTTVAASDAPSPVTP